MPRRANVRPDEPGYARVLLAGREVFGERGYEATSVAEIGERAGIAKSVLYHYFGSKAGLYAAILEDETRALVQRVNEALPPDPRSPRLRAGVNAYLGFLAERPAAWRLLLRDPPTQPELAELHARLDRERGAALSALLASPDKRSRKTAHVDLLTTAIRTFAAWWYDHRDVPREQVADAILDVARASARRIADAEATAV